MLVRVRKFLSAECGHDGPECVARVSVILLFAQRLFAGHRSEYQYPAASVDDRVETVDQFSHVLVFYGLKSGRRTSGRTKIRKNRAAGRFPSIFCQGLAYRAVVDRAAEVSLFYDRTAGQKRGDLFADGGGFGDFEHDEDGLVVPRDKK